ncbi:hypothetical protein XELAEV_18023957mg [Xenopus laevis]|uniref:Uncharacterized protein n=1 Tax=Xenopus laevis TaxID=8355 RepID=A0A974HQ40_XENLA|nr:hypothetical protein XELAEV_18023957mg [Xenopus laevis]
MHWQVFFNSTVYYGSRLQKHLRLQYGSRVATQTLVQIKPGALSSAYGVTEESSVCAHSTYEFAASLSSFHQSLLVQEKPRGAVLKAQCHFFLDK